jgi:hypothetical protein
METDAKVSWTDRLLAQKGRFDRWGLKRFFLWIRIGAGRCPNRQTHPPMIVNIIKTFGFVASLKSRNVNLA